eukprot:m.13890 g.13890  ORF g.13890 m.13890 type:complete len:650 (-) comp9901_c0_seq1:141-2090(-)
MKFGDSLKRVAFFLAGVLLSFASMYKNVWDKMEAEKAPLVQDNTPTSRLIPIIAAVVAVLVIVGVTTGAVVSHGQSSSAEGYGKGAVASDSEQCSQLGVTILQKGGSAVDAAITTTLCIGLVNSHSSGIGGGGFMVIKSGQTVETLDFRETAPAAVTQNMFTDFSSCRNDGGGGQDDISVCPSLLGGLAVAVPGELKGLRAAWEKYGVLTWSEVVQPVAQLCREGVKLTGANANAIQSNIANIRNSSIMSETFLPNGVALKEGDTIKRPLLAATLELIARSDSVEPFYSGEIAQGIVDEVNDNPFIKGIMTLDDIANYSVKWGKPIQGEYQGHKIWTMPPPGSGAVLMMSLNLLQTYNFSCEVGRDFLTDHRIIESFKFGYGYRTRLSDPCCSDGESGRCDNVTHCDVTSTFVEEMVSRALADQLRSKMWDNMTHADASWYGGDYDVQDTPGTTHLSVVGPNDDAVAVTSTINTHFGSKLMTKHGIILNNEMDDFSSPGITNAFGYDPSPANYIWPFKRPLSSMTPTIITSPQDKVEVVIGASGGSQITTAVVNVVLNVLSFCMSARDAIDAPRLHHQLLPDVVVGEAGYSTTKQALLERLGHNWTTRSVGVCQTITSGGVGPRDLPLDRIYAASDGKRKPGAKAAGYS